MSYKSIQVVNHIIRGHAQLNFDNYCHNYQKSYFASNFHHYHYHHHHYPHHHHHFVGFHSLKIA